MEFVGATSTTSGTTECDSIMAFTTDIWWSWDNRTPCCKNKLARANNVITAILKKTKHWKTQRNLVALGHLFFKELHVPVWLSWAVEKHTCVEAPVKPVFVYLFDWRDKLGKRGSGNSIMRNCRWNNIKKTWSPHFEKHYKFYTTECYLNYVVFFNIFMGSPCYGSLYVKDNMRKNLRSLQVQVGLRSNF